MDNNKPILGTIRRTNGVAGQMSYSVRVTYPGEDSRDVVFVGNVYGGPVVMVMAGLQTIVDNPERFGEFGPEWVRRFFA